jgi:hypothetical protein
MEARRAETRSGLVHDSRLLGSTPFSSHSVIGHTLCRFGMINVESDAKNTSLQNLALTA